MLKDEIITRMSTSPQKLRKEIGTSVGLPKLNSSKNSICLYRVKKVHGQVYIHCRPSIRAEFHLESAEPADAEPWIH